MTIRILIYSFSMFLSGTFAMAAHHAGNKASCADGLLEHYFATQEALAGDDLEKAQAGAKALQGAQKDAGCPKAIGEASLAILNSGDIKAARVAFKTLSDTFIPLIEKEGAGSGEAHLVFCPMAFDFTGASWLQKDKSVANPYFGAQMFACGAVKESFGLENK